MSKLIDLTGKYYGQLEVIEKGEKRGRDIFWKCLCHRCGQIKEIRGRTLREGKMKNCGCFTGEDLTGKRFSKLVILYPTEKRTKDRSIIWHCKCDCGNECDVSSKKLKQNNTKSCGCLNKENRVLIGKSNKKDLTGQTFGNLYVIEDSGQRYDNNVLWKCKCTCGNIKLIKETSLLHGVKSCGCISSKGEQKISKILIENNILFVPQKTFKNCIFPGTNRPAFFDFYINNEYLIEYDGEQHFNYKNGSGWNNKQNFEKTKQRDEFKNEWCKKNNIPLIRIPYWHFQELSINDLMLDRTKYLI